MFILQMHSNTNSAQVFMLLYYLNR